MATKAGRPTLHDLVEIGETAGDAIAGIAVTAVLRVSPNGDGSDGHTWATAFQTIQAALDAASTDTEDATLILIGPKATDYDIDRTGDPTWTANVVLVGTFRDWATIVNAHGSATSIMKLTGRAAFRQLKFDLGTGSVNGVIVTQSCPWFVFIQFNGKNLTGAATALHLDHATGGHHANLRNVDIFGHVTHMKGLLIDQFAEGNFDRVRVHDCLTGVQFVGANADHNLLDLVDIGGCALAFDIDAGNEQIFSQVELHGNTRNFDDEVGDHRFLNVQGAFPIAISPDNFTGVAVTAGVGADTWGNDTELIAAAAIDNPFRVVAVHAELAAGEKYRIRFSADSGSTHYDDILIEGAVNPTQRESAAFPPGTQPTFNAGTRISASAKSESGSNNVNLWLEIQEI